MDKEVSFVMLVVIGALLFSLATLVKQSWEAKRRHQKLEESYKIFEQAQQIETLLNGCGTNMNAVACLLSCEYARITIDACVKGLKKDLEDVLPPDEAKKLRMWIEDKEDCIWNPGFEEDCRKYMMKYLLKKEITSEA